MKGTMALQRAVFVCILCLSFIPNASADWTLAAFLGASRTNDTYLDITRSADRTDVRLSPVHYASDSFEPPPYYGFRAAFFPKEGHVGLESEFIHLKVTADTARLASVDGVIRGERVADDRAVHSVIQRFSITHGVNLLLVNAVIRHPGGAASAGSQPRWGLTIRAGLGASVPHAESAIDGVTLDGYEWGALALQGAAGVDVHLAGPVFATAEYKLTRTVQHVTIAGGSADTALLTQHLIGGLGLRLGRVVIRP